RRCADARTERHRPARHRHRPPPKRHLADPGQRRRGQHLYTDRNAARGRPAVLARTLHRAGWAPGQRRGGIMTRLRINGIEAEVAVTTIAELLAERGIDPKARFLA